MLYFLALIFTLLISRQQASHLNLNAIALPLVRRCQEQSTSYPSRIEKALKTIETDLNARVSTLVFGDLHLDHIRSWREDSLYLKEGIKLEYPLWKVDYEALIKDLEDSEVECEVTACPGPDATSLHADPTLVDLHPLSVGQAFDRCAMQRCERMGWDGFGEKGEFHTLAKVWVVSKEKALGMH